MKDTIAFCLRVDSEESYAEVANFIYKRENREIITAAEVERVSYKYYISHENRSSKQWATIVLNEKNMFLDIQKPQKIKNITERYEIIYIICVDKKSDIIDLGNLYLIKQHYTELNIIVLFPECEDAQYFTISQFLYSVGIRDKKFYDECFFEYRGNIQRAQINGIAFSRTFTPLQIIDKNNLNNLFRKSELELLETDELLSGAGKILCDVKKESLLDIKKQYGSIFKKLDSLAFVLLCYGISNYGTALEISLLEKYAFQMQQYSNAIRQLAENIVFHSKMKCGIIALRVHNQQSSYVAEKYKIRDITGSFLEIVISDFCRDNSGGSISDNFLKNLENDEMKYIFQELKPKSFFDHEDQKYKEAWERFYRDPKHIGKHFGLKIFQSIVTMFGGQFGAESHCSYISEPGDSFLSYQGKTFGHCMPGTRYHIVLPIENVQNAIKRQDLSLDSGINICNRVKNYLNYSVGDIVLSTRMSISLSQQKKNAQIEKIADDILQKITEKQKDIIYLSMKNIEDNTGEIIAKALVIALFRFQYDVKIVLYECADHLKKGIFDTVKVFFQNTDLEGMFFGRNVQIIMYAEGFEETVIDLGSSRNTDNINAYISHMKCVTSVEGYLNTDLDAFDLNSGASAYIPYDILYPVEIHGKSQTLFEHYTEQILVNNILESEFGCQLVHTHMRLGSTIHIDKFYEAEILFGNKLFVSRFAMLLVRDMKDDIKDIDKLTLYGYGTYSETVLVQMIEMIRYLYDDKKDVDYIILEREEERRGFLHKDRIRYNKYFLSKEERVKYFKDRKVAIIVLINSTLKTHRRLINLFKEENDMNSAEKQWLIKNYAVLLVGENKANTYWKLEDNRVVLCRHSISPIPKYFIQLDAEYSEPLECKQCFPENPIAEVPLIEVNAASTIPNQAFGIVQENDCQKLDLNYEIISAEEKKLESLKNELIYGHVHRNENHFLYYFRTENICIKQKDEIKESLKQWKKMQMQEGQSQYNIIVAPMHFSNAVFVELVNEVMFDGNAILLRIDFDKEYRCNAYAKYSYLRNYIEQLSAIDCTKRVNVHFVDDAIISGRTFWRAKSLMKSILDIPRDSTNSINIKVFDKVFVLVDRNSYESRNQYVDCNTLDFYAFINVNISSLRNYGDSCVCCNLKKEADLLFDTASTKAIGDYWKHCGEKFQLYSLEEYKEKYKYADSEKQFRRLFCTHMAQLVLKECYHGNNSVQVIYLILKLLNTDYESREIEKYEYFMSYLKCISRPFLVFKKAIKEAIFDIMLILLEALVYKKTIKEVIAEVNRDKAYLSQSKLMLQFNKLNCNILQSTEVSNENKKDLVKLLMKQLTELKSNYIIRPDKMDAIFAYMEGDNRDIFEKDYVKLIDRLVGASSDTNKSIWLDEHMMTSVFENVSLEFRVWVILENTRAFRDGIEKFYTQIYEDGVASRKVGEDVDFRINELEKFYDYNRLQRMFQDFEKKYKSELEDYKNDKIENSEVIDYTKKRIERFLKSLPDLPTLSIRGVCDAVQKGTDNWASIFYMVKRQLNIECEESINEEHNSEAQKNLMKYFTEEIDVYQYGNFYKTLETDYISGDGLSEKGVDMIICCVKVLELCRKNDMDVLQKVQLLAILFKIILQAQKVQFIIENKADSNLDKWKQDIEKAYNDIVGGINQQSNEKKLEEISIKGKKHYSVIVEKSGSSDYNTEVSVETELLIGCLEEMDSNECNYLIDNQGIVLWKLENNQRSIWINIENSAWCFEKPENKVIVAKSVRKIIMFYQELMCQIFNPENDDYINEISHARKELSIYNSNKIYTHTKDYSRAIFFEQAMQYFQSEDKSEQEKYLSNYPSHVLKLLADTNISQYYRYGLKMNFYRDDRGISNPAKWNQFSPLIKDGQIFKYCNGDDSILIKLNVLNIDRETEILCRNDTGSIREMTMLIHALVFNAAEQNRGKRKSEKTALQDMEEYVIVRIYKDADYFVIENECEKVVNIEHIKRKLHHIPDTEEDGISLWSFNCYIKRCINSLISEKLRKAKRDSNENEDKAIKHIRDIGEWIQKLTGDDFEIQPELVRTENDSFNFKVKIPILMEKYKKEN